MINKPTSNFAKLLRKLLDQIKFHILSHMTPEPLDSLILILVKEIQLNMILKRTKLSAGFQIHQVIWPTLQVVTTSVELEQSFMLRDIWEASILFT